MFNVFSSLKSLVALNKVIIENGVFILHCKVTVSILLVFTILITTKQHFGEPIDCLTGSEDVKFGRAVDEYCWIHSTFTVNELLNPKKVGKSAVQPGVGHYHPSRTTKTDHKYYQWVGFYLLFQAGLFYFPRFIWKLWEGGRLKVLTVSLDSILNRTESEVEQRKGKIVEYFLRNYHRHNAYAYRFITCEIVNCANVFGQIFLTNVFLGYHFSTYGQEIIKMLIIANYDESEGNPMDKVFPKVSKCIFNHFGASGNIVHQDVLCVLPLNILNEKIFIFLWFWFVFLAMVSMIGLLYRLLTIALPSVRAQRLQLIAALCDERMVQRVSQQCGYGDWFLLCLLGKNMDPVFYADIISELAFCFGSGYRLYGRRTRNGGCESTTVQKTYDRTSIIDPVYDTVEAPNP
ncbi:unnamed protein product [Orchesella dallaii]|uniref:Innexin n=1 Tax=Orchesella dallaii TaxID=48710 RepID=A0ABP1RF81_9HEXA